MYPYRGQRKQRADYPDWQQRSALDFKRVPRCKPSPNKPNGLLFRKQIIVPYFGAIREVYAPKLLRQGQHNAKNHAPYVSPFVCNPVAGGRCGYSLYTAYAWAQFHTDDPNLYPGDHGEAAADFDGEASTE